MTLTEVLPATLSSPNNAMTWTPGEMTGFGTLAVATKTAVVTYAVAEFGTRWDGRAFRLVKAGDGTDPESAAYCVFVHAGGQNHHCDCKGFAFGRGKPCKHILAALALLANGWV